MKIALISTSNSRNAGGLFVCVKNLSQSLKKIDNTYPTVLAFNDEYSSADIPTYSPVPIIDYNILGPPGIGFTIDLRKKLTALEPDIIHMHGIWLFTSLVNLNFSTKNHVPYLITTHGMLDPWIVNTRKWKKKLGLKLYENKHLKNASCIHALGIEEYRAIRSAGYCNPIAVIPNGINLPDQERSMQIKPHPEWKDNRKTILFLSRLHKKKGLENLVKAWSEIGNFKNEWKLVIAGESKSASFITKLKDLQKELNLENHIYFIGPQFNEDKDLCFREADAFILPSFSEGMPMAVLEAWSYRLPTLITEECNLPDGFKHNASIKISPNVEDIVLGLNKLFSLSNEQAEELGNNAFNLVKRKYTWNSISQQIRDVYKWIANEGDMPETVILN